MVLLVPPGPSELAPGGVREHSVPDDVGQPEVPKTLPRFVDDATSCVHLQQQMWTTEGCQRPSNTHIKSGPRPKSVGITNETHLNEPGLPALGPGAFLLFVSSVVFWAQGSKHMPVTNAHMPLALMRSTCAQNLSHHVQGWRPKIILSWPAALAKESAISVKVSIMCFAPQLFLNANVAVLQHCNGCAR